MMPRTTGDYVSYGASNLDRDHTFFGSKHRGVSCACRLVHPQHFGQSPSAPVMALPKTFITQLNGISTLTEPPTLD